MTIFEVNIGIEYEARDQEHADQIAQSIQHAIKRIIASNLDAPITHTVVGKTKTTTIFAEPKP